MADRRTYPWSGALLQRHVSDGPLWVTYGETGSVPDAFQPQSTFALLSVTDAGTLLVLGPATGPQRMDAV